jgi:hypothetical protein
MRPAKPLSAVRWAAKCQGIKMDNGYESASKLSIDWNKQLPSNTLLHKYGGVPNNSITLPVCGNCHKRYHLLFQIDMKDNTLDYLDLKSQEIIYFISCLNCATYEKPYYFIRRNNRIVILNESPSKYAPEYPEILEEYPVSIKQLLANEYPESKDGFYYTVPKKRGNHQLGGKPLWIQDAIHIPCITCNTEMSYLAMIDTELHIGKNGFREKGHMFGDNGILYVFVCRRCGIFSSIAQGM